MLRTPFAAITLTCALAMSACSAEADPIAAAIADEDRMAWELERDPVRHPDQVLAVLDLQPGDRVADLGTGGGYFAHLLANLVGPDGHVTAQNPAVWVANYGANWPEQHANLITHHSNVTVEVAELDATGFETESLDAITLALMYHDIALLDVDRAVMISDFYDALVPGGIVLITDHHGPEGDFAEVANSLHRGMKDVTVAEFTAAGFTVAGDFDFLENEADDLSRNVYDPAIRGRTSRFVLVFQKPE